MNKLARNIFKFNPLTHQNKYNLYLHEYQAYEILKKYGLPLVPVILPLFRALEPQPLMMPTALPTGSCPKPPSPSLSLTSSSRLKFMLVEEEKEHSEKMVSRVEFRLPPKLQKFWTMPKKCWAKP